MIFFTVCIYTETAIFIMTNVITAISTKICIYPPTDFAYRLCQELDIFQTIWYLYFPLLLSWITIRNNLFYVTRIFYRLFCLFYSYTSFSPPVLNHIICKIVLELCRVPVIPTLTSLTKIVGINNIHYKY